MSEIVAGLIGVVAGGLVTGAVQLFQAWQDRRLKRRVTARLIAGDLANAANVLNDILDAGHWPEEPVSFSDERAVWHTHREPFAIDVSAIEWFTVERAYMHLGDFPGIAEPEAALTEANREAIEQRRDRVDLALQVAYTRCGSARDRRQFEREAKAARPQTDITQ